MIFLILNHISYFEYPEFKVKGCFIYVVSRKRPPKNPKLFYYDKKYHSHSYRKVNGVPSPIVTLAQGILSDLGLRDHWVPR
jgi:hypothetical protein